MEKAFSKPRESGMELLRILSIGMVIGLHYLGTYAMANVISGSLNFYLGNMFKSLMIIGVNCFVLITGYFGIQSKGVKIRRLLDLLLTVAFFGAVFYVAAVLCQLATFSFSGLVNAMCPYIKGGLWFIRVYIVLALIAPFLNKGLTALSARQYLLLVVLLLVIFSVWPSFFPNPLVEDGGFGIVHFVVLYIIGGYVRLHWKKEWTGWVYLLAYFVFAGLTFVCSITEVVGTYYCYDFLFNMGASVMMLLAFTRLKFSSKPVNLIASTTFGVYVIHEAGAFHDWLYFGLFKVDQVCNTGWFVPNMLLMIVCQFAAAALLVLAQKYLFKYTIDPLLNKVRCLNKVWFAGDPKKQGITN